MINDPQCVRCKHLDREALRRDGLPRCAAFPVAVPVEIRLNDHDHRKPFPGDHGIRFEPIGALPAKGA